MGKKDKEYIARMEGMAKAYEIVIEKGAEGLKEEITKRGYFGADIRLTQKEYDNAMYMLSQTIYNNILTCSAYALNQEFGFGKERLQKYKKALEKATGDTFDWNYMCKQYVTMEDYAIYLNSLFDLGIDVERVGANEAVYQERREQQEAYKLEYTKGIINSLKLNGFFEASEFLESKFNKG